MNNPWTPGPWTVDQDGAVRDAEGYRVCGTVGSDANANLIYLAPEIAELLIHIRSHERTIWTDEFKIQVDSVLARARGESI